MESEESKEIRSKMESSLLFEREKTEDPTEDLAEMLGLDPVYHPEPVVAELTQIEVLDEIARAAWEISSGLDMVVDALREGIKLYKKVHQIEE